MLSTKDYLRHLIDCLTEEEAEKLLDAADNLALLGNADLATKSCCCPSCGEKRFDFLQWTADDAIVCSSCGTTYDPNAKGPLQPNE